MSLSTFEAECIALSIEIRDGITTIKLLKDLQLACNIITTLPQVICKVFEYKQSYVDVAKSKKNPARINHIAFKHHQLHDLVDKKKSKAATLIRNIKCQIY